MQETVMESTKAAVAPVLAAILLNLGGVALGSHTAPPPGQAETVVLIHGMGRTQWSMRVLGWRLERVGYRVRYYAYPTPSDSLRSVSQGLVDAIRANADGLPYHLVAHSLGNVILRDAFQIGYPEGLSRVVMLAPPNRPAALARRLADNPLYRRATGEPGQLLADPEFYSSLPVPTVRFGVIAGTRPILPLFNEPNDGIVAVSSTRLEGMADWSTVDQTHTLLMNSDETFRLVRRFLEEDRYGVGEANDLETWHAGASGIE